MRSKLVVAVLLAAMMIMSAGLIAAPPNPPDTPTPPDDPDDPDPTPEPPDDGDGGGYNPPQTQAPDENEPPVVVVPWEEKDVKFLDMVTLDASESYDPDGEIVSYTWKRGRVVVSEEPTHEFECRLGRQIFTIIVEDNDGATAEAQVTVNGKTSLDEDEEPPATTQPPTTEPPIIAPEDTTPPIIDIEFVPSLYCKEGEGILLDASETMDEAGVVQSYEWRNADGTVLSTELEFMYEGEPGLNGLNLKVTDDSGNENTMSLLVYVEPEPVPPTAEEDDETEEDSVFINPLSLGIGLIAGLVIGGGAVFITKRE